MRKGEKRKQQKALARRTERKAAKRSERAVSQGSLGLRVLRQARSYPLLGCWTQPGWDQTGLAPVIVARRQRDGLVVFGDFLVDYYCLGVKSAFFNVDIPHTRFMDEYLPKMLMGKRPQEITPDLAHEMIYGSVEYAARWGFRPDPDFRRAQLVLDPPEDHPITGKIEFGKDGKPFFVSGPHDNVDAIVRQLTRNAGEGNFHYLASIGPPPFDIMMDDEDDEWEEEYDAPTA